MRRFVRHIIASFLILLGFVKRQNKIVHSKNLITSIYFHNPSKELFEKCINWLINNNYHFISTDNLYDILNSKASVKEGAVCITVDDGWRGNLQNIIPVVTKMSIPLTIFVSTEPVRSGSFWWSYVSNHNKISKKNISVVKCKNIPNIQREQIINKLKTKIVLPREAMTKEEVIIISKFKNITIGNHTVNHPITKRCDMDELKFEITKASEVLKAWINCDINFFAYPNGDFDEREIPVLKDNNIKLAFSTVPEHIDMSETINRFQIPRFSINDNGSFNENICKMLGVWQKYIK